MVPDVARGSRIPVTVLTGFLGSGKTTLLNRFLRRPSFANTAVIVNELGEIGLDHLLVERGEDNVLLLDSGCLCCGLQAACGKRWRISSCDGPAGACRGSSAS